MIKVVTSQEMREMDRYTIEELGVPGVVLMENAGRGTFFSIEEIIRDYIHPRIYIFCGKGNNGGDGFVIARHLFDIGADVQVLMIGRRADVKGDARINFDILEKLDVPIHYLSKATDLKKFSAAPAPDLVVDALLGTGITGAVHGFMKNVIGVINAMGCPVVSVDIPSGLNADSPLVAGVAVKADITVSMALPKRCHLFYPAREFVGSLQVADIGIPDLVRNSPAVWLQAVEKSDIQLPRRSPDFHKYQCGKVGVLAGSPGYTGAAALTAQAAMRMGAGLVILGIPSELNNILEMKLTEVITKPYGKKEFVSGDDPAVLELLEWCDVLALGPGLGRSPKTQQAIIALLKNFKKPVVIDADALFALANHRKTLQQSHPHWILTPHHGEFIRLLPDISKADFQNQFIDLARRFAEENEVVLLLKGAPSLVADPEGQVFVNTTGNPGLASGGTGDVLTGMIAGLLAQDMEAVSAVITASYLHGLCADDLVKEKTEYSLLAGDLIDQIGPTLQKHFLSNE